MRGPYVDRLQVQNYFCIKSVDVRLTPLHAFIGPNDSGKSTLLRAIASLAIAGSRARFPTDALPVARGSMVTAAVRDEVSVVRDSAENRSAPAGVVQAIRNIQIIRLDPDGLREPANLIPSTNPMTFTSSRGHGLAALCDAIAGRDTDAWIAIRDRFLSMFPTIKALEIRNASTSHKELGARLKDGSSVSAKYMSEGMLYWLAFAAMAASDRPSIYLVEEPENGLHPSRIGDVVRVLRKISEVAQVIIATHSPLVINELRPEEISIVTRPPDKGTQVTPMTATKNFEQRSKVYALGELWLSYADGDLEKELTDPSDEAGTKASA